MVITLTDQNNNPINLKDTNIRITLLFRSRKKKYHLYNRNNCIRKIYSLVVLNHFLLININQEVLVLVRMVVLVLVLTWIRLLASLS
jgi:hypothetical protein